VILQSYLHQDALRTAGSVEDDLSVDHSEDMYSHNMMDLNLTIEESLSDKPSFRWKIEDNEKDITDLEAILDKVSKSCRTFCDTGKAFCDSMGPFTEGISDLANHFQADDEIKVYIILHLNSVGCFIHIDPEYILILNNF